MSEIFRTSPIPPPVERSVLYPEDERLLAFPPNLSTVIICSRMAGAIVYPGVIPQSIAEIKFTRRDFLKGVATGVATTALILSGCNGETQEIIPPPELLRGIKSWYENFKNLILWVAGRFPEAKETTPPKAELPSFQDLNLFAALSLAARTNATIAETVERPDFWQTLANLATIYLNHGRRLAEASSQLPPLPTMGYAANLITLFHKLPPAAQESLRPEAEEVLRALVSKIATEDPLQTIAEIQQQELTLQTITLFTKFPFLVILTSQSEERRREIVDECFSKYFEIAKQDGLTFGDLNPSLFQSFYDWCVQNSLQATSLPDFARQVGKNLDQMGEEFREEVEAELRGKAQQLSRLWGIPEEEIGQALLPWKEIKIRFIQIYSTFMLLGALKARGKNLVEIFTEGLTTAFRIINESSGSLLTSAITAVLQEEINYLRELKDEELPTTSPSIQQQLEYFRAGGEVTQELINAAEEELTENLAKQLVKRAFYGNPRRRFLPPHLQKISYYPHSFLGNLFGEILVWTPPNPENPSVIRSELYCPTPWLVGDPNLFQRIEKGGRLVRVGNVSFFVPRDYWQQFVAQNPEYKNWDKITIKADGETFNLTVPCPDGSVVPMEFLFVVPCRVLDLNPKNPLAFSSIKYVAIFKNPASGSFCLSYGDGEKENDYFEFTEFETIGTEKILVRGPNNQIFELINLPPGFYTDGLNLIDCLLQRLARSFILGEDSLLNFIVSPSQVEREGWVEPARWSTWGNSKDNRAIAPLTLVAITRKGNIGYPLGFNVSPNLYPVYTSKSKPQIVYDEKGNPYLVLYEIPEPPPGEFAQMPRGFEVAAQLINSLGATSLAFAIPLHQDNLVCSVFKQGPFLEREASEIRGTALLLISEAINLLIFCKIPGLWKAIAKTGADPGTVVTNFLLYSAIKRLYGVRD